VSVNFEPDAVRPSTPSGSPRADLVYTSLDGDEASHVAARGDGSYEGILAASGTSCAPASP